MAEMGCHDDDVEARTVVRYLSMTHKPFHMGVLCDDLTASVCSASAEMLASSPLIDARIATSLSAFSFELRTRADGQRSPTALHRCRTSINPAWKSASHESWTMP